MGSDNAILVINPARNVIWTFFLDDTDCKDFAAEKNFSRIFVFQKPSRKAELLANTTSKAALKSLSETVIRYAQQEKLLRVGFAMHEYQ